MRGGIRLGCAGNRVAGFFRRAVSGSHGLEVRHVSSAARACRRPSHRLQRGLTLIEMLVSLALLATIAGVVAAAYSVSLKALGAGGAPDRLIGAHNQEMFEQLLGKDVARASCIQAYRGSTYGSCSTGFANATITSACTNSLAVLCVGWPQVSDLSCHVAVYTSSSDEARRQEYVVASDSSVTPGANNGITTDPVTMSVTPQLVTPPSGGSWVGTITVAVTSRGVPPADLVLHPLSSDPHGPASAIGPSGAPC